MRLRRLGAYGCPMDSFEVGIVGGGIHGVSAAYHLARGGVRTVLLERGFPACGPTGRSSAVCRAYYTNGFLAEVARDALGMFRDFSELTADGDAGYRATGALFLHGPEDVDAVNKAADHLNAIGTKTEVLDVPTLERRFPDLSFGDVACGVWETHAGYADPALTTNSLYQAAKAHGLETRLSTTVVGIESDGEGVRVATGNGTRLACERLLIAAGPWTAPLAKLVGIEIPLTVERHWVVTCRWGPIEPIPFVFSDIPGGYYGKPEGSELFCLGPLTAEAEADPDDFNEGLQDGEALQLVRAVSERYPALTDSAEVRGGWASLYDVSPDWQPVIGEIAPGVFVDAGTSGHGFKLAPALGTHVADLVMGKPVDPGLEQFHPRRFTDGRLIEAGYGAAKILG